MNTAIDKGHNVSMMNKEKNRRREISIRDSLDFFEEHSNWYHWIEMKWIGNYLNSKRWNSNPVQALFIVRFVCLYVHTMQQRLMKGGSRHICDLLFICMLQSHHHHHRHQCRIVRMCTSNKGWNWSYTKYSCSTPRTDDMASGEATGIRRAQLFVLNASFGV